MEEPQGEDARGAARKRAHPSPALKFWPEIADKSEGVPCLARIRACVPAELAIAGMAAEI